MRSVVFPVLVTVAAAPLWLVGAAPDLVTFDNGTVADADQVNQNFSDLRAAQTIVWQRKDLGAGSGALGAGTRLTNIEFTGLDTTKTYRLSGKLFGSCYDFTNCDLAISILDGNSSTQLGRWYQRINASGLSRNQHGSATTNIFQPTQTFIRVEVGTNTGNEFTIDPTTYLILEELPNHSNTGSW